MVELVRVGDLCSYALGYENGNLLNAYCKITSIKDEFGNLYNEYYIVTGQGDKNSKVKIDLKGLVYCNDLKTNHVFYGDINNKIIKDINPHKLSFHYKYWLKETEEKIEFLLKKKEFLLKNKNIIDKINSIL